jgi:hypothetical protein
MTKNVCNTHEQLLAARECGLPDVAIISRVRNGGRTTWVDGWKVYRPGFNLGTETNRYDWDYGVKVFSENRLDESGTWRERRARALQEAKEWVKNRYKIQAFTRNRLRAYVSSDVNKKFPLPKRSRGAK